MKKIKISLLVFMLLFLIQLKATLADGRVHILLKDSDNNYIYSSSCSQTPRIQWNNIILYVYNSSNDLIIATGTQPCNISIDLPAAQYRIKVIGRRDSDQAYLPLFEKTINILDSTVYNLGTEEIARVSFRSIDLDGNNLYASGSEGCALSPSQAWNNLIVYIYIDIGNQIFGSTYMGCKTSFSLPQGTYRIKMIGKRDPDQQALPLYEKILTLGNENTYNISTSDLARLSLIIKDSYGNHLYASGSEGCTLSPTQGWNNLVLYLYNESGDQIFGSSYMGCKTSFSLPQGTYRIKMIGRRDSDQDYFPLYEKTLNLYENTKFNLSTQEMALVGFTIKDDIGKYLYAPGGDGCSFPNITSWSNIRFFIYNEGGASITGSNYMGCTVTFGLPNGTYRIVMDGRKDSDQAYHPLYDKTLNLEESTNVQLGTEDMARFGLTLQDELGAYLYAPGGDGCPFAPLQPYNQIYLYIYNETEELLLASPYTGCKSTFALPEGTYNIEVIGKRDSDQSYFPLYDKTMAVAEETIHQLHTSQMALVGLTIQDNSNYIYASGSEGCSLLPTKLWNNINFYIYDIGNNLIASSAYMGCKTLLGLKEGVYNFTIQARNTSTSIWLFASNKALYEENKSCSVIANIETNNFASNCYDPNLESFLLYSLNPTGISQKIGESKDYTLYLYNIAPSTKNFSIYVTGLDGSWYELDQSIVSVEANQVLVLNLNLQAPLDSNNIGNYTFNVSAQELVSGEVVSVKYSLELERTFSIDQVSNISLAAGENRNLAITIDNLATFSGNFTLGIIGIPSSWYTLPPTTEIPASSSSILALTLHPPLDCENIGNYTFQITYLREESAETQDDPFLLQIISNPTGYNLYPVNGSNHSHLREVQITWETNINSTTEVYYKLESETNYTKIEGPSGLLHSIALINLEIDADYMYYVKSATLCGFGQSAPRYFHIYNGSKPLFYESFNSFESISNNSGVIAGVVNFTNHSCSNAANLTSSYVTYPLGSFFKSYDSTIEFWVRAGGRGYFDTGRLIGGHPNSMGIFRTGSNVITEIGGGGSTQSWSPPDFKLGNWNHVAVTFSSMIGNCRYVQTYLNGNPGTPKYVCNWYPEYNADMWIGRVYWSSYGYANALMDEFEIFDYAKTYDEIQEDYQRMKYCTRTILPPPVCNMSKPLSTGPVKINCSGLYVNGEPFTAKGVGYQPIPIGRTAESIPDKQFMFNDVRIRQRDFPLLRAMGANTIRTWSEVLNISFMDDLYNGGVDPIYVLMGFWMDCNMDYGSATVRQNFIDKFTAYVNEYKDHPAVLAWAIGNENNLGYCSGGYSLADYNSLANELARIAYEIEGEDYHPIGIINGHLGGIGVPEDNGNDGFLNYTDFWGANVYTGSSFGSFFDDYRDLSGKPLMITEYGTDALNNSNYQEMEDIQRDWNIGLWREINASNITIGSTVMAWSDEWWKGDVFGGCGDKFTHDYECGHGDFPTPDGWSNEEWFGVVRTVQNPNASGADLMEPRLLYYAFRQAWGQQTSFDLSLNQGWNLISTPLNTNFDVSAFTDIYAYNGSWYVPSALDPKKGYWVKSDISTILSIDGTEVTNKEVPLQTGWNLIGYPYLEEKTPSSIYESNIIYSYNSSWSSYSPNRTSNHLQTLKPGYGYWVKND